LGVLIYGGAIKTDCHRCDKFTPEQRKYKGCDGPSAEELEYDGVKYSGCPGRLVTNQTRLAIEVYSSCEQFHCLPAEGGLYDQTFCFSQILSTIQKVLADIQKEKEKE